MKKNDRKAIFVSFVSLFSYFSCVFSSYAGVSYQKNEIVFMKWGAGVGEVGSMMNVSDGVTDCVGPAQLGLDGQGDFYVMDAINRKIDVFFPDGKMKKVIMLSEDEGGSLSVDGNGDVLISRDHKGGHTVTHSLLVKNDGEKIEYKILGRYLINGFIYDEKGRAITEAKGAGQDSENGQHAFRFFRDDYSCDRDGTVSIRGDRLKDRFQKKYGKDISDNSINLAIPAQGNLWISREIIGMDRRENIYVLCGYYDTVSNKDKRLRSECVYVFSMSGTLRGKIDLPLDMCSDRTDPRRVKLDFFGNIYQLISLEDGAHIYKWSQQ